MLPILTGGKHERNRRAGTENVPGDRRPGRRRAARSRQDDRRGGTRRARCAIGSRSGILASVPGTAVNGARSTRVPNTTNISFDRVEAESLLIALDLEGIAVSTGSACSSGHARAVARAQGDGPPGAPHAELAPLQPRAAAPPSAEVDRVVDDRCRGSSRKLREPDANQAAVGVVASLEVMHAHRRRDVGRRGFVGRRGPARRAGPRRHRSVDAALRSERGPDARSAAAARSTICTTRAASRPRSTSRTTS